MGCACNGFGHNHKMGVLREFGISRQASPDWDWFGLGHFYLIFFFSPYCIS